jgi:hypothetical protein
MFTLCPARRLAGVAPRPLHCVAGPPALQLSRLDGLQHLVQLEELSLEDNQLRSLDAIEPLKLLKKLDVGKNQLTSVSRQ